MVNGSRAALLAAVLIANTTAWAVDPAEPENLPPPRKVVAIDPANYRTNRWDVWQFYAVDRQGTFRPRVVYTPNGFHYLYNGAPYLYGSTRQLDFTPVASGTPYRAAPALMPYCPED